MMKQCIYLVIQMYFMQIYFTFYDLGIYLQILLNYKGKQNFEKIPRANIRLNLKVNDLILTISSNLLYFNFAKSRQKTIDTMNVSNLRRNSVNIVLGNYLMKPLKSTYLYPSVLVVGLYQTH